MDKLSSAQFLDQRREKLSSLDVTLLSLSFSDPPPRLTIRKSQVALLLDYWQNNDSLLFHYSSISIIPAFTGYCRDFMECEDVGDVNNVSAV